MELEKRILRRKTDRGTDVGLNLDPGVKLHVMEMSLKMEM